MTKKRQEAVQTERTLVEQTAIEQPKANVKYKDTIFRMLFSEPEHLLSLYNAVTGKDYRDLFYIASEYQVLADGKSLYSSGIQKIPTPKFLVFYNGLDRKVPDRMELRLSDAYENPVDEPDLELKVTMLNINAGHNEELMNSCHVLQEYARYVARVRKYVAEMPLDEAVERAVTECIREGILAEFLKKNRAEVVKVSIFEYDKEKEEKKLRKAEYEYGFSDGEKSGHETGFSEGRESGFSEGQNHAAIETARRMLQSNKFTIEEIAKFSGLSQQEVETISSDA